MNLSLKIKFVCTALFFLSATILGAQSFNPFQKGFSYYYRVLPLQYDSFFKSNITFIYPYKITSVGVSSDADSVYNFRQTLDIDNINNDCFRLINPSIFGKSINVSELRKVSFVNLDGDSITLFCNDSVGSKNVCYKNKVKGIYVEALLTKKELTKIFDEFDSLLTFKFFPYDSLKNLLIQHPLYAKEVSLSYGNGFVNTVDWRNFPENSDIKKLVGISDNDFIIRKGLTGFYSHQINDFDVSDEIQTEYYKLDATQYSYNKKVYSASIYTISKITGKLNIPDTVIYEISREIWNKGYNDSASIRIQSWDSVTTKTESLKVPVSFEKKDFLQPDTLIEKSSMLLYFEEAGVYSVDQSSESMYQKSIDTCWRFIIDSSPIPSREYYTGFGGYFYDYEDKWPIGGGYYNAFNKVVFAKKGNKTYGKAYPYTLGVKNEAKRASVSVYPNPTTDYINISDLPEKNIHIFYLFNQQGQLLLQSEVMNNTQVKLPNVTSGMYFFKIINSSGLTMSVGKLIIQE